MVSTSTITDATLLVPLQVSAPTPARKHKDRTQRATRSLILRLPVGVNMLLVFRTSKEVPQPPMQTHVQRLHDLATSDLIKSTAFFATVAYLLELWGGLLTLLWAGGPPFSDSSVVYTRDDVIREKCLQPRTCAARRCPILAFSASVGRLLCGWDFVPKGLKRYYGQGDIHFITCSCYRRLPPLTHDAITTLKLR